MKNIIVLTLLIAVIYFLAITYLMNSRLAIDTLIGNYSLSYKINLLVNLVLGMWSAMGTFALGILFITALLLGANLALLFQRIVTMSKLGNVHVVVGGSSLLGVATSGCAACGLPILSFLGVSGSLVFLPFRGLELSYFSLTLLSLSLVLLIRTRSTSNCSIK